MNHGHNMGPHSMMPNDTIMTAPTGGGHAEMDHTAGLRGHSIGHAMYFHFGKSAIILFEEWDVNSTKGMVWSCVVVFLMAVLYEGFKVGRELLREKYIAANTSQVSRTNGHVPGAKDAYETTIFNGGNKVFNWHHILQSFLHVIQVAVSYVLMLITMTFNGYLFICVCVGAGVGYFLFSWKITKAFDLNEHCH